MISPAVTAALYTNRRALMTEADELIRRGRTEQTMAGCEKISQQLQEINEALSCIGMVLKRNRLPPMDLYDQQFFPGKLTEKYGDDTYVNHYSLGFAFHRLHNSRPDNYLDWDLIVALKKSGWQAGKLNGVGGRVVIEDECPAQSMCREFMEEAGIETQVSDWTPIGSISAIELNPGLEPYFVHCFATFLHGETYERIFSEKKQVDNERETVFSLGFPQTIMDQRTLPNVPLMMFAAAHALLNNQANVDKSASQPQVHLAYVNGI